MSLNVICPGCGFRQELPDDYPRRKVRCPECGVFCPVPEAATPSPAKASRPRAKDEEEMIARMLGETDEPPPAPRPRPAPPVAPPRPPREHIEHHEDDGRPYVVDGPEEVQCPKCKRVLAEGAVVCVACGFDLRSGKKFKQTFAPMEREWDLGLQFPLRIKLFTLFVAGSAIVSLIVAPMMGQELAVFLSWLWLVGMLAFLLGTFFHVRLTRDKRGRVRLVRRWRICFVPRKPHEIDLREYLGVRRGMSRDAGIFEWLIFLDLFLSGIIPGVLFWYHVINKDRHHVVLTRDHGYSAVLLYRGNDAALTEEVTAALRDAARLREETH